jgi:hypothetical protein
MLDREMLRREIAGMLRARGLIDGDLVDQLIELFVRRCREMLGRDA